MGIHATYLSPDGSKRVNRGDEDRRMMGDCYGSFVQLSPIHSHHKLILTPDIETAVFLQFIYPDETVWCAMSLGNMKAKLPDCVGQVSYYVDVRYHDPHLVEGALRDAARVHKKGRSRVLVAKLEIASSIRKFLLKE
jgi:hypothetical protein